MKKKGRFEESGVVIGNEKLFEGCKALGLLKWLEGKVS